MLFAGIDIGTTNCKIGVYDQQGHRILNTEFLTPAEQLEHGWSCYDMEKLWQLLTQHLKELLRGRAKEVQAIGVSSQGESCLLTDENFIPITKAIPWYDTRTKEYVKCWADRMGADRIYKRTGLQLQSIYTIMKLEWMKEQQPAAYEKAFKFHCISDYIAGRMTGVHGITLSMASRTMALDIRTGEWSEEMILAAGIKKSLFPDLLKSGNPLGAVTEHFAAETGIFSGCSVSIAGFDHVVGCIGAGAVEKNMVVASIGTTESICLLEDKLKLQDRYYGYLWGIHVLPHKFYSIGGIPAGGQTIDWVIKNILQQEAVKEGYKYFENLCGQSPPLCNGVLFLPHLSGCCAPVMDNFSKASFWGIHKHTTLSDMARATIEGLCYEFKLVLEQSGRDDIEEIIAIGGGSRNGFWMQCKADVLGIPVTAIKLQDAVTYGGAGIAAENSGNKIKLNQLHMETRKRYVPNQRNNQLYAKVYSQIYKKLYQSQVQITRNMADILNEEGR